MVMVQMSLGPEIRLFCYQMKFMLASEGLTKVIA